MKESGPTAAPRRTDPPRIRAIKAIATAGTNTRIVTPVGMIQGKSPPSRMKSRSIRRLFTISMPRSRKPAIRPIQSASSSTVPGPAPTGSVPRSAAPTFGSGDPSFAILG